MCVLGAGACWGTTGTIQELAPNGATSLSIGAMRIITAGCFFILYLIVNNRVNKIKSIKGYSGVIISAVGLTFYQLSFFKAVSMMGVASGTMVSIGTAPIIAGMLGIILYKEKICLRWVVATAVSIVGCLFLIFPDTQINFKNINMYSFSLALGAAFFYTLIGIGFRKVKCNSDIYAVALVTIVSMCMLIPVALKENLSWVVSLHGLTIIALLGFLATVIPMILFSIGSKKISLGKTYTLGLSEPLIAWGLATFKLKEPTSLSSIMGAILILSSILILAGAKEEDLNNSPSS